MDNADVLMEILARVDHETLLGLHKKGAWSLVQRVMRKSGFWKLRAEFTVGKVLSERGEANWMRIYGVLRLGRSVLTPLYMPTTGVLIPGVEITKWVYEYALDYLPSMEAAVEAYGPPDWKRLQPDFIWRDITSTRVLQYLIEKQGLPLQPAGSGLIAAASRRRMDIIRFVLPLIQDSYSIEHVAMESIRVGTEEVFELLMPRLTLEVKKRSLKHAMDYGNAPVVHLLLQDKTVGKAGIPALRKSINRGHMDLTSYLLTIVNIGKKSEVLLTLAARRSSEMVHLLLQDKRIDSTPFIVNYTESRLSWGVSIAATILQSDRLKVSELSATCLAILMRSALMIDGERTDSLKYWRVSQEVSQEGVDSFYEDLFLYLMTRVKTWRQAMKWIEEHRSNVLVASALQSIVNNTLPSIQQAEPMRALILALVYPSVTAEQHIQHLIEEKTSESNLLLSARLITAYLP